jgi:hypothetical protein
MAELRDMDHVLGLGLSNRLAAELRSALRRKPLHEPLLAGAFQVLCRYSDGISEEAVAALDVLTRRNSFERPLYVGILRGLVERADPRVVIPLVRALGREGGGGLSTIAAAALSSEPDLLEPLLRLANSRAAYVAFAAELALLARGESTSDRLLSIAPRLKESYRISLLTEVVLPLIRKRKPVLGAHSAFAVLRDSERHLGRWLCFAESAKLAGDESVVSIALSAATKGAASARMGWSLVAWALEPQSPNCDFRPTVELLARLSERPSAERELSFLFRMAEARHASVKPVLENLCKHSSALNEAAIRAHGHLVRDFEKTEHRAKLIEISKSSKYEELRGLSLACLYDASPQRFEQVSTELDQSRKLPTAVWGALVRIALACGTQERLVTEAMFRRVQLGWPD